jgi:hypothetical protein
MRRLVGDRDARGARLLRKAVVVARPWGLEEVVKLPGERLRIADDGTKASCEGTHKAANKAVNVEAGRLNFMVFVFG